jgi:hypothetical protein
MRIRNVLHRGLRRLIENDDESGVQPAVVAKLRRIISFLQDMEREDCGADLEGASPDRQPERKLELVCDEKLAVDVPD